MTTAGEDLYCPVLKKHNISFYSVGERNRTIAQVCLSCPLRECIYITREGKREKERMNKNSWGTLILTQGEKGGTR